MNPDQWMWVNALGLAPFDPARNVPRDVGLGGPSTEYLATAPMFGGIVNYPTIWWDEAGNPVLLDGDAAWSMAHDYQQATGQRFPKFHNINTAEWAAKSRSAQGGATRNALAGSYPLIQRNALGGQ